MSTSHPPHLPRFTSSLVHRMCLKSDAPPLPSSFRRPKGIPSIASFFPPPSVGSPSNFIGFFLEVFLFPAFPPAVGKTLSICFSPPGSTPPYTGKMVSFPPMRTPAFLTLPFLAASQLFIQPLVTFHFPHRAFDPPSL